MSSVGFLIGNIRLVTAALVGCIASCHSASVADKTFGPGKLAARIVGILDSSEPALAILN